MQQYETEDDRWQDQAYELDWEYYQWEQQQKKSLHKKVIEHLQNNKLLHICLVGYVFGILILLISAATGYWL